MQSNIYEGLELLPQDLQGWNGNSDVFRQLIEKTNPKVIIEVGTWKGQSAINMAKVIKEQNRDCKIYCVDTWLGSLEFIDDNTPERDLMKKNGYPQVYYQFLSNVVHNGVQDIIIPFPQTSLIAARWFNSKCIKSQLIYIDASHDEEDLYTDIASYIGIIDNGIIFGDDITWEGATDVVGYFGNYSTIENNFWILEKQQHEF